MKLVQWLCTIITPFYPHRYDCTGGDFFFIKESLRIFADSCFAYMFFVNSKASFK